jgi:hypothetical protein
MNNEFKKSKSNNETRYTLESMTAGATGSGSVATATGSLGKVQKRGNILAQEAGKDKVPATTPRNFVAKNAKTSGAGAHKDKKKEQKQGAEKHKKPYMESLRTKIDQLKSRLAEQGVAEGDRPGMKDGRPYSDPLRRHPGNDSYMTPEYLIQKYQDELKKIAAGPYKRPKDVAMYQARIAKLQRQQGVAEGFPKDPNAPKLVRDRKTGKQYDPNKEFEKKMNSPEVMAQMKRMAQKEGVEDRTSYQVAKILSDRGIKYDPAQENELINAIGMVLVKELNMTPKEARNLISYDEDFVADTLGELRSMEQSVSEVDVYMESLAHSLQQVLSEKAVSKKQQKFMGMVHAAQKGEKPASKEVAKVAKDMGKKDAKDFASTKHKGLPEKKKSKK